LAVASSVSRISRILKGVQLVVEHSLHQGDLWLPVHPLPPQEGPHHMAGGLALPVPGVGITLFDSRGTFSSFLGFGGPLSAEDPQSHSCINIPETFNWACCWNLPLGYFATNAKF
jgi:hypothetical protein